MLGSMKSKQNGTRKRKDSLYVFLRLPGISLLLARHVSLMSVPFAKELFLRLHSCQ